MIVVIPMAGKGKRFFEAGYTFPKPIIDINGKPMIQHVVENLNFSGKHIFIAQNEHVKKFSLNELFSLVKDNFHIISLEKITEGAAITVLLAKEEINNDEELIIANSDQLVDWNSQHFISYMRKNDADGGIVTFISTHPKWSFVKTDEDGIVKQVAEKKPISNIATVGIYYFKKGRYFVEAAEEMIKKNIRTNQEFYVAPAYNELISKGMKILEYPVSEMFSLGTPEDLQQFLISKFQKKEDVV